MELATDGNRIRSVAPKSAVVIESPAPAATPPAFRRIRTSLPAVAVAGCVLLGLGLRTAAYARNQSFWIDEAMLALNVVYKTPAELLRPLDLNQGAPVGYLMLSKLAAQMLGGGEPALRLPSFLAALAGCAVFIPLAYRALPLPAARLAVCLFALSPYLVGYAAEFKQYELDATIALALAAVGLPVWRDGAGRWRLTGFAAAGGVAVWFSHPAVFVLGGVGLAALADAAARRDRAALLTRVAVVGVWVVSFAACYLLFLRHLGMNQYLLDYWAGKFMPLPPVRPGEWAWVVHHFLEFFETPGGLNPTAFGAGGLAAVCFLVAGVRLGRDDWRTLVALAAPLALAMLASGVKKYPFAGRLLLFAVPAALLMVGYGASVIAAALARTQPGAGAVVIAVLFVAPVAECYWHTKRPIHAEDAREVIAHAHANWRAGDRAYVYYGAVPAFAYYQPRYPFPADAVRFGMENRGGDQRRFQEEVRALRGSPRVWVVVAHRQTHEETALRAYLDSLGRCDETVRKADAVVFRYDLSRPPVE